MARDFNSSIEVSLVLLSPQQREHLFFFLDNQQRELLLLRLFLIFHVAKTQRFKTIFCVACL